MPATRTGLLTKLSWEWRRLQLHPTKLLRFNNTTSSAAANGIGIAPGGWRAFGKTYEEAARRSRETPGFFQAQLHRRRQGGRLAANDSCPPQYGILSTDKFHSWGQYPCFATDVTLTVTNGSHFIKNKKKRFEIIFTKWLRLSCSSEVQIN